MKKTIFILISLIATAVFAQWSEPERLSGGIDSELRLIEWPSINEMQDTLYYTMSTGAEEDVFYSYRYDDSLWSEPIRVNIVSDDQRQVSPCIGPGDSILYYVSYGREGGFGSYDIWFTRRGPNGQWMEPENAGPNVNTPGMEWGVFLSRSGQNLYFSSSYQTGAFLDIKKSERQGNEWGQAESLPGQVNWWDDQEHVTLPSDESFLILTMERSAITHHDLWQSDFGNNEWSAVTRLDELNYERRERGASLTPDGNTVYFASQRIDSLPNSSQIYISHRVTPIEPVRGALPTRGIHIFPNPINGNNLFIDISGLNGHETIEVIFFDVLGRRTFASTLHSYSGNNAILFLGDQPSGKYWIQFRTKSETNILPLTILR